MQGYYVSAAGQMTIVFSGPHGLTNALRFAEMARGTKMVEDVRVGVSFGRAR